MMGEIVLLVFACLGMAIVLSFFSKSIKKSDQSFTMNYFKLTYRKKLKRTLIVLVVLAAALIAAPFLLNIDLEENLILWCLLVIPFSFQALYNYYMWKKKEQ
ncbi:hypothetical protein [Halobacillus sp. B23F22_1]|uniref:hypothetical protein n=1 Tax=Halobacillus sp. B23F22_1 TaxID=3459514 RepID=UPI00373F2E08